MVFGRFRNFLSGLVHTSSGSVIFQPEDQLADVFKKSLCRNRLKFLLFQAQLI